jgi:hypothetical protein
MRRLLELQLMLSVVLSRAGAQQLIHGSAFGENNAEAFLRWTYSHTIAFEMIRSGLGPARSKFPAWNQQDVLLRPHTVPVKYCYYQLTSVLPTCR